VIFRLGVPLVRSVWHDLRVARVLEEGPTVTSIEIEGRRLGALKARAGQFFTWRFLTRDRWWEAHPFSLSAAPDGRRLRITVKGLGDYTSALRAIPPGTRVIAEGPFGAFTTAARRRPRVALIAGGVGITPIRALLEDMPGGPGDIAVVYRALAEGDVILRAELDELATRRGAEVHYVIGEPLSPERLLALVPDIAARDVYVCGSPGDDRGDAREPRPHRRVAAAHRHRAVRVLMPKVIVALLVTAVAVVLLAGYDTKPPRTVNPNSALKTRPKAAPKLPPARARRSARRRSRRSRSSRCRRRSSTGS
jgi:ferredoxin-NADP reductase